MIQGDVVTVVIDHANKRQHVVEDVVFHWVNFTQRTIQYRTDAGKTMLIQWGLNDTIGIIANP